MTMSLSLHEYPEFSESNVSLDAIQSIRAPTAESKAEGLHFFPEKIAMPKFADALDRPRLTELMEKSLTQFGATLISGRAGTGKTVLASKFAERFKHVAWYTAESSDGDWKVFSQYFSASLVNPAVMPASFNAEVHTPDELTETFISNFIVDHILRFAWGRRDKPLLIVLDDIHHVFDTTWFNDFFSLLLYSLLPNTHLLLLCRSKPPLPLWRLRSKQLLNVIDEKLLAFDPDETEQLFKLHGLSKTAARRVHGGTFGRVSKLMKSIDAVSPDDAAPHSNSKI
jgi:ATP/maltotriose-dependent transcriptional regulator MalT